MGSAPSTYVCLVCLAGTKEAPARFLGSSRERAAEGGRKGEGERDHPVRCKQKWRGRLCLVHPARMPPHRLRAACLTACEPVSLRATVPTSERQHRRRTTEGGNSRERMLLLSSSWRHLLMLACVLSVCSLVRSIVQQPPLPHTAQRRVCTDLQHSTEKGYPPLGAAADTGW
jgi:hypothetical protein